MECANGGNLEEFINVQASPINTHAPNENLTPRERAIRERRLRQASFINDAQSSATSQPTYSRRTLQLDEIYALFVDICAGLLHLHDQGIVHRDLKPSNLLLHYSNPAHQTGIPRVLISDFGECEILDQLTERDRTGATGTLAFMAPELLTVDSTGKYLKEYSPKSDMWSLGIVLYYLCYSRLPYRQIEDVDLLKDEILHFKRLVERKFPIIIKLD